MMNTLYTYQSEAPPTTAIEWVAPLVDFMMTVLSQIMIHGITVHENRIPNRQNMKSNNSRDHNSISKRTTTRDIFKRTGFVNSNI